MSITYVGRYEAVSISPSKIAHSRPNANQKSQSAGWTLRFVPMWIFREGPPHPISFMYISRDQPEAPTMEVAQEKTTPTPTQSGPTPAKKASEAYGTSLSPLNLCSLHLLPLLLPPPHEHLPCPISPGPAPITTSAWQLFKPTDSYLTEAFVLYCLFYVKKCLLSWKSTLEKLCSY